MKRYKHDDKCIFYKEWLPLKKNLFRILLAIVIDNGFTGTLSDLCPPLGLVNNARNRNNIKKCLEELSELNFVKIDTVDKTAFSIEIIVRENPIPIFKQAVVDIKAKPFSGCSVENVMKLYVWAAQSHGEVATEVDIGKEIGIGKASVARAKKIFRNYYPDALLIDTITKLREDGRIITYGQTIKINAWWSSPFEK